MFRSMLLLPPTDEEEYFPLTDRLGRKRLEMRRRNRKPYRQLIFPQLTDLPITAYAEFLLGDCRE